MTDPWVVTTDRAFADRTSALNQAAVRRIKMELAGRDWHQSDLARSLGVTEKWISRRLRMELPLSLDELDRIAGALGVGVADLLPPDAGRDSRVTARYRDMPEWADDEYPTGRSPEGDSSAGRVDPDRRPRRPIPSPRRMPRSQLVAA